ncbi:MAG TPA: hypothetical protein VK929_01485 [Longimicrobiales bacterium]|nr:hypothetical protein [Longimicrobiales bacterium]
MSGQHDNDGPGQPVRPDELDTHHPRPDAAGHDEPGAEELALFSERGRDLLLLALALVLANEALFAGVTIAGGHPAPVANVGRFTMLAAMSYMTWQGFSISRWILVILAAVAAIVGPAQVLESLSAGRPLWAAVLALTGAGYALSFFLLAFQGDVARFIRHRRLLRDRDVMR